MKKILKKSFLYPIWYKYRLKRNRKKVIAKWALSGCPLPPPHEYKSSVVLNYADKHNINVLIETGTYYGNMIEGTLFNFKKIKSIELDNKLYLRAKCKFVDFDHVELYEGDSSVVLKQIIKNINEPTIFWLDGHYSGGVTAKGTLNTPIMEELKSILNISNYKNVILIDDARHFDGTLDYPHIEEVMDFIKMHDSNLQFKVEEDIIRISH